MMNAAARLATAGAIAALAAGAALADDAPSADTVLATVGGIDITLGHVLVARGDLPEQFRELPAETLFQPMLEQLVEQTALMLTGEDRVGLRDRLQLENNRRTTIANAVLDHATTDAVSDAAISEAYEGFVAEFDAGEPVVEYNASHIIVATEDQATALRAELDEGAEFAALAREHSTDGAAQGGGSLGWFGPGMMIPEFEEAVAAMEIGDITGPLETRFGWHLVTLDDTRVATVPALEDIRAELVQMLRRDAAQAEIARAVAATEITRADVEIDPSVLGRLDLLNE